MTALSVVIGVPSRSPIGLEPRSRSHYERTNGRTDGERTHVRHKSSRSETCARIQNLRHLAVCESQPLTRCEVFTDAADAAAKAEAYRLAKAQRDTEDRQPTPTPTSGTRPADNTHEETRP